MSGRGDYRNVVILPGLVEMGEKRDVEPLDRGRC